MTATAAERKILEDLYAILDGAKGDHPALADVRRQAALQIDSFVAGLATHGIDTDALLDEIEGV